MGHVDIVCSRYRLVIQKDVIMGVSGMNTEKHVPTELCWVDRLMALSLYLPLSLHVSLPHRSRDRTDLLL